MDEKLKRRIMLFYMAGAVNVLIGGYVLLFGREFLTNEQYMTIVLFFAGFAALDFYFPRMLKKKWAAEQAKHAAQKRALTPQPPQS